MCMLVHTKFIKVYVQLKSLDWGCMLFFVSSVIQQAGYAFFSVASHCLYTM